jgi:signal transduction histidine kinase
VLRLICLLLSLPITALLAQTPSDIAELEKKIAAAPREAQFALQLDLADRLEQVDVDRALAAAARARELATQPADQLAVLAAQAAILRTRGSYPEAMQLARAGLGEANTLASDRLRARFYYLIARTQWNLADYTAATASFHDAIQLAEKAGDLALLCDAETGLATIFHDLRQPDQESVHLEVARKLAEQLNDARRLGDYYKVLGNQRATAGDHAGARAAHERSRQIHEQAGNDRGVADALQNLAALAVTPEELAQGEADCLRAIATYLQLGQPRPRLNAERELGRVLVQLGRPQEALPHLTTSLQLARQLNVRSAAASAYRELAAAHEAAGDLRAALDAQRHFQIETDAVLGERARQQIAVLNVTYEAGKRETEIALLRGEQARKQAELNAKNTALVAADLALGRAKAIRLALGMGILAGAVGLGAFFLHQRTRLRAERRLHAETQAAKEAAEEADRVKTRFLGIATHDIRAPLGHIVTLAGDLRKTAPSAEHAEDLDALASEAQRVLCLVEELLTLSALETGGLSLHRAPLELAEVTHAAIDALRWQATAKRQTIGFQSPPPGTTTLTGDAQRLHQVVTNLVSNAIKFSPPGSAIAVSFTRGESTLTLAVRDAGPGLSPEDAAKLFQPFGRLSAHPTAGESSHGLGLSIAHEIVRLHGGAIRVESQPGAGATFLIDLPLPTVVSA